MMDPASIPDVSSEELLARFATQSSQYRRTDGSVKQDLFMPHPRRELSVTRHRSATLDEIWRIGWSVAGPMGRTLYGRSDVTALDCSIDGLSVVAAPLLPENPNHADVVGWPESKQDKKAIAQKLAAAATKLIPPPDAGEFAR